MSLRIDKAQLAYELARRDWRYKKLAELSGVSRATVSAISSGKTVTLDTAEKIACALSMPVDELVERKER